MATRLWRIYRNEPELRGDIRLHDSTGKRIPNAPREVYLTTLSAPSAEAALAKYNRSYGSVMGEGEYAIEDEDVTGSRVV